MTPKIDEQNRQLHLQSQDSLLECLNPTPVRGGVYITPPTEKYRLLLKIVILKSPNFVTFPIYL